MCPNKTGKLFQNKCQLFMVVIKSSLWSLGVLRMLFLHLTLALLMNETKNKNSWQIRCWTKYVELKIKIRHKARNFIWCYSFNLHLLSRAFATNFVIYLLERNASTNKYARWSRSLISQKKVFVIYLKNWNQLTS